MTVVVLVQEDMLVPVRTRSAGIADTQLDAADVDKVTEVESEEQAEVGTTHIRSSQWAIWAAERHIAHRLDRVGMPLLHRQVHTPSAAVPTLCSARPLLDAVEF